MSAVPFSSTDQAAIRRFIDDPDVGDVLRLMCFECGPPARIFRLDGHEIRKRAEDEQAFVMRRALERVLTHGNGWRNALGEDMSAILAKHQETKAAKAHAEAASINRPLIGDAAS